MKSWWWFLAGLVVLLWCWMRATEGGELIDPPPLPSEPVAEQRYLSLIAEHHNNLAHYTTGNPNGVRRGKPGDLLWATFGGSDRICVNTGTGPGLTTTWKCVAF